MWLKGGTIIAQDTQLVCSHTSPHSLLAESQGKDRFPSLEAESLKEDKYETEDLYY